MSKRALQSPFVATRVVVKAAILSSSWVIGCLVLALPAASQPLPLATSNGCDLWVALGGEMELQPPFGSGGTLPLQMVSSGQLVTLDFECVDFPPEPPIQGVLNSVAICNWRMEENGVKGTTRAEIKWFPDPEVPGRFSYYLSGQIIRGNRYPTGATSGQGVIDMIAGTVTADSFLAVFCRNLGH